MSRPLLESWRLICDTTLVGKVSGHPEIPNGWITTSEIVELNRAEGWVRTESRYYSLGTELSAYEALPEGGRQQIVNRLMRNYEMTGRTLSLEMIERIEDFATKLALPPEKVS